MGLIRVRGIAGRQLKGQTQPNNSGPFSSGLVGAAGNPQSYNAGRTIFLRGLDVGEPVYGGGGVGQPYLGNIPAGLSFSLFSVSIINGTANAGNLQAPISSQYGTTGIVSPSFSSNAQLSARAAYSDATQSNTSNVAHGVSTNGGLLVACMTYAAGETDGIKLYISGNEAAVATPQNKAIAFAAGSRWNVGYRTTGTRDFLQAAVAVWNRVLSSNEVKALSRNPWQIFEPRRIWVPVGAASGPPTLAAIAASNLTTSGARLTVT